MKKFRLALVFGLLVVAFMIWQLAREEQTENTDETPSQGVQTHYLEP